MFLVVAIRFDLFLFVSICFYSFRFGSIRFEYRLSSEAAEFSSEAAEFSSEAKELRCEATELNSEATEFSPGRFALQFVLLCKSEENLSEATQFSPGRFARQFVWFCESKESLHVPKVYVFQRKSMVLGTPSAKIMRNVEELGGQGTPPSNRTSCKVCFSSAICMIVRNQRAH